MSEATGATTAPYDHHRGAAPLLRRTSTLRGVLFVAANLLGFLAVNAFSLHLATGRWVDFSIAGYRKALATPLTEVMLDPLGIFYHPWMILVVGLLISAIVFVPIMVAVLYRLWVSVMFLLAVAAVGHSPLLAAFLAAGCVLAGHTRLRSNFPFLALLVGLVPVGVYLGFFAYGRETVVGPLQAFVLYMVLILAAVAAMLAGGVVLALARLTRYRPGVIWPVLLVFLGLPGTVFYGKVGPAELDYALIARGLEGSDNVFRPESLAGFARSHPDVSGAAGDPESMLAAVENDLDRRRSRLRQQCATFLRGHPASRHGPAVMWIQAAVKDVRIDPQAFRDGLVKYSTQSPSKVSLGDWGALADRHDRTPQAGVARQRLGIDALRDGRVQKAQEDLHIARSFLKTPRGGTGARAAESVWAAVFVPFELLPGEEYYREVLAQTEQIIWLISENKVIEGDQANVNAFADYMRLWPFRGLDPRALADLAASSKNTELEDNHALLEAMEAKDALKRAGKLSALTAGLKDAAIIAHYELGRLGLRHGSRPEWIIRQLKSAEHYFGVVRRARQNPYKTLAEQHLARLAARKPPAR